MSLGGAFILLKIHECGFQEEHVRPKNNLLFSFHKGEHGKNRLVDTATNSQTSPTFLDINTLAHPLNLELQLNHNKHSNVHPEYFRYIIKYQ